MLNTKSTKKNKVNYKITLFFMFQLSISVCFAETGFPGFDVFTSALKMGLGGAGFLNPSPISAKLNPATSDSGRYFSTSIIRYQAGITSQSAGISFPWKKGFGSFSVRHISYGTFAGYNNEFQSTGKYQSADSWFQGGYTQQVKGLPLTFGTTSQFYSSSLKDHQIKAFVISIGGEFIIKKSQTIIGLSIRNIGKTFSGNELANGSFNIESVLSGSKKLAHLPLTLFIDGILSNNQDEPEIFLGGEFKLKNGIQMRWGTSTRKIDHNTKQDFLRSVFGASGFGFGFIAGTTVINYGTFIFGTGSTIHGLEIGIRF